MTKRARTERREAARAAAKLAQARMKLAALEEGGAPTRPIEVESASVVEPHASSMPCAACGASGVRVEEHVAITVGEARLRVARVRCAQCSVKRDVFFRIGTTLPS
ncbi:MAG: hypothetical protein JST00_24515 [Deltaproteobacteria bacterium]|nr:hypothetical protein [Deltaproteobacteria bacterium]